MTGSMQSPDQHGQTHPQKAQPQESNPQKAQPQKIMPMPSTALDLARLKTALMHPQGDFGRVEVVASAGSTNTDLAAAAADPQQYWPDPSVLIADAQPAGKGRLGRAWEVPAGAAMISSVLVWPGEQHAAGATNAPGATNAAATANSTGTTATPDFAPTGYGWLSILAGVALCESLSNLAGVPAELKWPNDVVVGGRKLAGILAQVVPATMPATTPATMPATTPATTPATMPAAGRAGMPAQATPSAPATVVGMRAQAGFGVVIGAGVNVSLTAEELPTERATSLLLEGATTLDRNELLAAYLNTFAARYRDFVNVGGDAQKAMPGGLSMLELAEAHLSTLGQEVRAELPGGTMLHGTAIALGIDGGLDIRDAAGQIHHVSAGDVIHLRRTTVDGAVKYA